MFSNNPFSPVLISVLLSCSLLVSTCSNSFTKFSLPYKTAEPTNNYKLKKSLREISGLSVLDDKHVAVIDDEIGSIFYYNLLTEKIIGKVKFGPQGDWEDLVLKGDTAYVLNSNGTIIEVCGIKSYDTTRVIHTYDTELNIKNDAEGLCYDYENNRLLIACKGRPGLEKSEESYKGTRAIYSFDLKTKKLNLTPVILIDLIKLEGMVLGMQKNVIRRLMKLYNINTSETFRPSGLSIHPVTKDIYIISAVGNILLILSPEGNIKKALKLSPHIFKQPEGIAFDKTSNLFISNEGKAGKGNILKFNYDSKSEI
jgi:DNA-binding beta-propeller fold protein YncE